MRQQAAQADHIPFDYIKRRLGYFSFLFLLQFCRNEIRIK